MENSNPVQDPQNQVPSRQPPPASQGAESRKRALEIDMQDNAYFKMRSVLNEMRPQVLEGAVHESRSAGVTGLKVLQTPDFRNCNAAQELREKLNMLMELYKQMTTETVVRSITKPKISRESHTFYGENEAGHSISKKNEAGQKPQEQLQNGKPQPGEVDNQAHIIGGSAFGWNFISFPGNEPVFYGRTKESFRAAQETSTQGA